MRNLFLLLTLILCACVSIEDLRTREPVYSGTHAGRHDRLSACAVHRYIGTGHYPAEYIKHLPGIDENTSVVTESVDMLALFEARFIQKTENKVSVEVRASNNAYGQPHKSYRTFVESVKHCG